MIHLFIKYAFIGACLVSLISCQYTTFKSKKFGKDGKVIITDGYSRAILGKEGRGNFGEIACAEPPPDAILSVAAKVGVGGSFLGAEGRLNLLLAALGKDISYRTQTTEVLKQALYRVCEIFYNSAANSYVSMILHQEIYDATLIIAAIDRLAGTSNIELRETIVSALENIKTESKKNIPQNINNITINRENISEPIAYKIIDMIEKYMNRESVEIACLVFLNQQVIDNKSMLRRREGYLTSHVDLLKENSRSIDRSRIITKFYDDHLRKHDDVAEKISKPISWCIRYLAKNSQSKLAWAEEIKAVSYNIDGGFKPDADIDVIAEYMKKVGPTDIWGLSEVSIEWKNKLIEAAEDGAYGASYGVVHTTKSEKIFDSLVILYRKDKFDMVGDKIELTNIAPGDYSRAPLAVKLLHKKSGKIFIYMVNHLDRGNNNNRRFQAREINKYGNKSPYPIVAMGDYNFDWEVGANPPKYGIGYAFMVKDGIFQWIKPKNLIKTGCHPAYNSILDFAFISDKENSISARSRILFDQLEYCEPGSRRPDHRPVELVFDLVPSRY